MPLFEESCQKRGFSVRFSEGGTVFRVLLRARQIRAKSGLDAPVPGKPFDDEYSYIMKICYELMLTLRALNIPLAGICQVTSVVSITTIVPGRSFSRISHGATRLLFVSLMSC